MLVSSIHEDINAFPTQATIHQYFMKKTQIESIFSMNTETELNFYLLKHAEDAASLCLYRKKETQKLRELAQRKPCLNFSKPIVLNQQIRKLDKKALTIDYFMKKKKKNSPSCRLITYITYCVTQDPHISEHPHTLK